MADPKHTAPRSSSEVPSRTPAGEEALPTSKEAPPRQVTPTGYVKMHEDDNNTKVEIKTIDADVEKARIAANLVLVKTIGMWASGALATICAVITVGIALYFGHPEVAGVVGALVVLGIAVVLGRQLTLKAPGVDATTGSAPPPPIPPAPPADGANDG